MKTLKKFKLAIIILFTYMALAIWMPTIAKNSTRVTLDYFKEMAIIMPPVFILMGLIEVWIPKDKIKEWLGKDSGVRGAMISIALGTLPTGPLYVSFPMTASLLRSGASVNNMVLFLGSWAALKIPQLMIEIKFLGLSFTLLRFTLTLISLIIMGVIMDVTLKKNPDENWIYNINKNS